MSRARQIAGYPRSFAVARAAAAAHRCDFLLGPFPACSLATRKPIGAFPPRPNFASGQEFPTDAGS